MARSKNFIPAAPTGFVKDEDGKGYHALPHKSRPRATITKNAADGRWILTQFTRKKQVTRHWEPMEAAAYYNGLIAKEALGAGTMEVPQGAGATFQPHRARPHHGSTRP